MQIQVDRETREVLARGHFPAGVPDDAVEIVDLDDEQAARMLEPGRKTLAEDGTLAVEPPELDAVSGPAPGRTPGEIAAALEESQAAVDGADVDPSTKAAINAALAPLRALFGGAS